MDIFVNDYLIPGVIIVVQSAVLMTALLILVAYLLYADRKVWAAVQLRRGPNVVGPWGLFQSFADLANRSRDREPLAPFVGVIEPAAG